ncbi:MAG TPA: indole-3-glycerol phosphate synthase TrpC [Ignavibacteriaceae bacterium]|nr:indole-3-glycerol phosphate synthase TrpC [Ignavibacteriaceae bacterium]
MNILNQILEAKKIEVSGLRKKFTFNSFREMEFFEKKSLCFTESLRKNGSISIIAEIKKASPSKGLIREDFNHKKIADIYFKEEVQAVSVLTDSNFFQGKLKFLSEIAKDKQAPLLRKDFIIDEYQVFESKAHGADIILLIAEALTKNQINELSYAAAEAGVEVLLEMHSKDQLDKIDFRLNNLIGINNRNLEDFSVDLETTAGLSAKLPEEIFIVSESGIKTKDDVKFLKENRTDAILVGEYLMKAKDISSKLIELKEWCRFES